MLGFGYKRGGGATLLPLGNVHYVSPNGDDATAIKGRLDKPYQTLLAAMNAMASGEEIFVFPFTYNPAGFITVPAGKTVNITFYDASLDCNLVLGSTTTVLNLTGNEGSYLGRIEGPGKLNAFGIGRLNYVFGWAGAPDWVITSCKLVNPSNVCDVRNRTFFRGCILRSTSGVAINTNQNGIIELFDCQVYSVGDCTNPVYFLRATNCYFESTTGKGVATQYRIYLKDCRVKSFGLPLQVIGGVFSASTAQLYDCVLEATNAAQANSITMSQPTAVVINQLHCYNLRMNRPIALAGTNALESGGIYESDQVTANL